MNTELEIKSSKIIALQEELSESLHKKCDINGAAEESVFTKAVKENMVCNFKLWHLEDEARRDDLRDYQIVELKRNIDKENQKRNDFIEEIDKVLITILPRLTPREKEHLPMNSETPGAIIDRLGIGSLKIYHMNEEATRVSVPITHIKNCRNKLELLISQRKDLAGAFSQLIEDLFNRRKQLRIYRQFKMYNDPDLNPALYERNN